MERITKVFFNLLARTKADIRTLLQTLPVGAAHPFNPGRLLLLLNVTGFEEIEISSYPESYFFSAVDLGDLGLTLQRRTVKFASELSKSQRLTFEPR
jgi:hypothetical protein